MIVDRELMEASGSAAEATQAVFLEQSTCGRDTLDVGAGWVGSFERETAMRRDSQKFGRFSMLVMLGLLPAVCGCSPKPPVRTDPEPKASIGKSSVDEARQLSAA